MKKLKIGVFGAWRGSNYINLFLDEEAIDLVCICDKNAAIAGEKCGDERLKDVKMFAEFDEFLKYGKSVGVSAVFLANYFHQHAPFAIRAMEEGFDIVSECTAASTLKECVELVECVERTGRKYMLAENYPFSNKNLKMYEIIEEGTLGTLLYAEGEYNHSEATEELRRLTPGPYHWRAWMPRTYYVTHAMGPVMYLSNSMPKYVSARASHSELLNQIKDWRHNTDGVGMMFCEMDNGMIARFTGCTAMASSSRYRVCGDLASVENGGHLGDDVRLQWFDHTKPENEEESVKTVDSDLSSLGELGERAKKAGHDGGDFWIVQQMIKYFLEDEEPFFNVYRSVAMSATGILGWRSCLNHGENIKIPDFTNKEERDAVRDDDLTPFPDENGNGATLPPATRV